jgi:hypothetical protein
MLAQIMQMLKYQNLRPNKIESSIKMNWQSLMANSLRIMEWNANGILRHQHELELILSTENTDICYYLYNTVFRVTQFVEAD